MPTMMTLTTYIASSMTCLLNYRNDEIQWRDDGARCKVLTASLVDAHFQALGERAEGEEPLLPREK